MGIFHITNAPSPYKINFFNLLGKRVDLTVYFDSYKFSNRDASWQNFYVSNFEAIFPKEIKTGGSNYSLISVNKQLNNHVNDWIIVGNAMSFLGLLMIAYMRLHGITFWIKGDGAFVSKEGKIKYLIKRFILKEAEGVLSSCENHSLYYKKYGVPDEKIYRYPFTSVYKKDVLERPLLPKEKEVIRNSLNMREKYILLSVGKHVKRKGFDNFKKISRLLGQEFGIYLVGKDEECEYTFENYDNIHEVEFIGKNDLERYYKAADVFVFPTRYDIWGLVINEAMAYGLPVITTSMCNAGLELIENEENGYIVPVDDTEAMSEKIKVIVEKNNIYEMGLKSIEKIKEYTLEAMVDRHMEIYGEMRDSRCKAKER